MRKDEEAEASVMMMIPGSVFWDDEDER
jgi:hypothetical protein